MTQPPATLKLPDYVDLSLTAQDAVTVLGALQNSDGPFKAISTALNAVQQQLMAQAVKPVNDTAAEKEFIDHHPV